MFGIGGFWDFDSGFGTSVTVNGHKYDYTPEHGSFDDWFEDCFGNIVIVDFGANPAFYFNPEFDSSFYQNTKILIESPVINPVIPYCTNNPSFHYEAGKIYFCLKPVTQNSISCTSATNLIKFQNVDGFWKLEVDGVLYAPSESFYMTDLFSYISNHTLLSTLLVAELVADEYIIRNIDSNDHRVKLIGKSYVHGSGYPVYIHSSDFGNPTFQSEGFESWEATATFCLKAISAVSLSLLNFDGTNLFCGQADDLTLVNSSNQILYKAGD